MIWIYIVFEPNYTMQNLHVLQPNMRLALDSPVGLPFEIPDFLQYF